jgi:DNA-binding LacI/PurR family transcriptional regulator
MIKLEDLARHAGVSVSTVSRALTAHPAVNTETRDRIVALAAEHGYEATPRRARSSALGSASGATLSFSIVLAPSAHAVPRAFDPFSLSLIGGIGAAMRERGLPLTISPYVPDSKAALTRFLEENQSDGLIMLGQRELHGALNDLAKTSRPFVVWGAETEDQLYCSVGSDNLRGGQRATSHLLRLGRRRPAFIGSSSTIELQQRRLGYETAMREAGLAVDPAMIRESALDPGAAMEVVDDMLDRGVDVDSIVAASDLVALGAIRSLARRGLGVPDDVAVVGYDDIEIAEHAHPSLTTIRQDTAKAGRLLVGKLITLLEGRRPTSERLATELIVRESCGA